MAFSSNFFIFAYLPLVLLLYFASPSWARNFVLLVVSLLFYAFDAGLLAWLLIVSILLNYYAGHWIAHNSGWARNALFAATIVLNVAFLLHYKYTVFLWSAAEPVLSLIGLHIGKPSNIVLPIGISFLVLQ